MKTITKRTLATVGAMAMALSALAGCGSGSNNAAASVDAASASFPLTETVTFTALTHEPSFARQELNDRLIVQRLEEATNVHIDWTVYVDDQFSDNADHYVVNNDKQVVYTLADEGIVPGLEWLHTLYAEGLIDPEVFTQDYNTYVSKAASDRYGLFLAWDNTSASTPDNYVALPPLKNADGEPTVTRQNAMGFEIGRCVITGTNPNPALTAKWIDQLYAPIQSVQDNWGTYGDTTQDNIFEMKDDGTLQHLPVPEGVVPYELRMKTNPGGPLAVLDSYYGTYTTKPDDASLRRHLPARRGTGHRLAGRLQGLPLRHPEPHRRTRPFGHPGRYFANANGCGEAASPSGIHVIDTTGAGDIFGGSAMSRFLKLNKAPAT